MSRRTYSAGNREVLPGTLVLSDEQQSTDAVVQAAHDNAREACRYYHGTFGRDSYDNKGAPLVSTVHFGQSYSNAYWSSSRRQMVYGDGDGTGWLPLAYALDIVGHEFTHAVTSNTARFVYAEQSGALDEAFADFFGVMITNDEEIVDWLMGEGVYTPLRSGDALRDLSDPSRFGLPDHMDDFIPLRAGEQPDPDKNDMGWLHSNCGILAKAAYLAVAGGEQHGIDGDLRWRLRQSKNIFRKLRQKINPGNLFHVNEYLHDGVEENVARFRVAFSRPWPHPSRV